MGEVTANYSYCVCVIRHGTTVDSSMGSEFDQEL